MEVGERDEHFAQLQFVLLDLLRAFHAIRVLPAKEEALGKNWKK
jgi:hypothetical protein